MPTGIYPRTKKHLELLKKARTFIIYKPLSEEAKEKIRKANLGKKLSEKTKKKLSESHKGKKHTEETKRKISENHRHFQSEETKRKMSESSRKRFENPQNHPSWQGGISFEPYSVDWTETLKRSIRERDHYTCQLCGEEPAVYCHHIDYDKKNCNPENLIILCIGCHAKTNYNRDYWIKYFRSKG